MRDAIASEGMKALPPVAVTLSSAVSGIAPNEWVAIATIVYIILQAGYLAWKWIKEYRASK